MSEAKKTTRRQFLIGASVVTLAAIGGTGYWATRQPTINFIEKSYGDPATADHHMLVAYASQYGSTGGVADAVAQAFYQQGAAVDVRRVENISNVEAYDVVVVGAPIHTNEWMPAARNFIKAHRNTLANKPTAYFLTCMTLALSTDVKERNDVVKVLEAIEKDFPSVTPVGMGFFAGALDYGTMSPAMQVLYRVFSEDDTDGDYRDFGAIRDWATALYPNLIEV